MNLIDKNTQKQQTAAAKTTTPLQKLLTRSRACSYIFWTNINTRLQGWGVFKIAAPEKQGAPSETKDKCQATLI